MLTLAAKMLGVLGCLGGVCFFYTLTTTSTRSLLESRAAPRSITLLFWARLQCVIWFKERVSSGGCWLRLWELRDAN